MKQALKLSKFEFILWISSVLSVSGAFFLSPAKDYLTLIASLVGVTALVFVAKGHVIGQVLTVIFALFYAFISFYFQYYGEMITYLFMTAPIAVITALTWYKNPYKASAEVTVNKVGSQQIIIMISLTVMVTIIFYFVLAVLNTTNMLFSTISIATSFIASYLTLLRSPYYAIGYMANDTVLIILWVSATLVNKAYFPMIICFAVFFINDFYGFLNWDKMKKRQHEE